MPINIITNEKDPEIFSMEKLTITLFELTYSIGEPNLELCEKLAKTIFENLSNKNLNEISKNELKLQIKNTLLEQKHNNLLDAFINRHQKQEEQTKNLLREKIFSFVFNNEYENHIDEETLKKIFENQPELINNIISYIDKGNFYPSTSIFLNTNNHYFFSSQTLAIEDNLEDIFQKLFKKSKYHKNNIPTSINLSNLRSKDQIVSSTNKKACGVKSIVDFYIQSQELIINNKLKNAKNLFYINIEHPETTYLLKSNKPLPINFVFLVPNRFMTNLQENKIYYLKKENEQYTETPKEESEFSVNPNNLLDLLFTKSLDNGKYDFIFIDKLNKKNNFENTTFEISPVGYQPVYQENSFFTSVIDVSKFVKSTGTIKTFDWNYFKEIIHNSIYFLDSCIDNTSYIDETLEKNLKKRRQIYLSITGYFKLLELLEVPYESDDSLLFAESLSEFITYHSKKASIELSKEKGPFQEYNKSKYMNNNIFEYNKGVQKTLFSEVTKARKLLSNKPLVDWDELKNNQRKFGIRNSTTYSIIFSDIYSFANNTSNSINPQEKYTHINIEGENYPIDNKNQELPSNSFLIKLHSVFEKFCDGLCNINLFYNNKPEAITDMKKDLINTYLASNLCYLPKIVSEEDTYFLTTDIKDAAGI